MPPLSTVLSVTMTQIISTLARLPRWVWYPGHTPAFQSALYPILTDDMFPPDLLQELVSLLPRTQWHTSLCSARWCSTASKRQPAPRWSAPSSSLQSLSKLMDVQASLGSCPVANLLVSSDHWLADPGWLAGQRLSAFPSWASSFSPPSSQWRTWLWRTSSSRGRP